MNNPNQKTDMLHIHLRSWRKQKGLSQEQVGNILGHDKSTIQRWEAGKRAVDLEDLAKLAQIYGVSPLALLLAPGEVAIAEQLTKAERILRTAPTGAAAKWLDMGDELRQREDKG